MTESLEYLQPVNVVAECLGLSPRRVRQFTEEGNLPRLSRGLVDLTFAMYFHIACLQVSDWANKPQDSKILVAMSWLSALSSEPSAKEINSFVELFERNKFTRDQALLAIGRAQGLRKDV